ncbi:MmcQ/YjbR family DNA-binding protein [Phenylobacterium sp.]|uniref:MmcQ/YjbR family DNA-binding protein n=1 Tax=Phenylobacterium sp. TaxID=1871053 RepID=UPI003BADB3EE
MSLSAATLQTVLEGRPGAVGSPLPSAPGVVLYKVMGKMFAILTLKGEPSVIVKCDSHLVEILREQYEGVGHRSHLDRRFWICVTLDSDVPSDEIERLVAGSYDLIRAGLTRKQRAELDALS